MNKKLMAKELLKVAKDLLAVAVLGATYKVKVEGDRGFVSIFIEELTSVRVEDINETAESIMTKYNPKLSVFHIKIALGDLYANATPFRVATTYTIEAEKVKMTTDEIVSKLESMGFKER